ncbi:MAG: cell filamentation protein [Pseudonocardiales bacterium]|nr:cell filamentation protein [Pseudonocardiales bacterium]
MTWDPYLDLAHGVLRNLLNITDSAALRHAEADFTTVRIAQLVREPIPGDYDLTHLQALHRHIFQDVYDWAGQVRTVSIGKGAALFSRPEHIEADADELFAWLARTEYLRGRSRAEFVDGLTELLSDLNAVHPFREGNGRTQRAFLGQLARDAGHPIRWVGLDAEENAIASKAGHEGDDQPLHAMLDRLVERR